MSGVGVGIVGLGNVGRGTLQILADNAGQIEAKLGFPIDVRAVCSRSVMSNPPPQVERFAGAARTADWREVVANPQVEIVCELVGGVNAAADIVRAAIEHGKSVVTANKELMAQCGAELWERASAAGVSLAMEASVAGGIPIHTALREGIAGDRILKLVGILNGTCNYILTEMERRGEPLETILAEAQELGYAEADPSADIDGYDARSKLALLAGLAFGVRVDPAQIYVEGIRRVRPIDFAYANRLGHTIRLLAAAQMNEEGLTLAVRPSLVPRRSILASVDGSYNAVWVRGFHGEDTFYYGRGAGPQPTGVAVVSDILRAAGDLRRGGPPASPFGYRRLHEQMPLPIWTQTRPHYLRFRVEDRPGILAELAAILAAASISVEAVLQEPGHDPQDLPFVITLESTPGQAVRDALAGMKDLPFLVEPPLALPMELEEQARY